ncbi:hypothetical protein VAS14_06378 [Photobacterium angustum S14]|uniref:Oligosaccharide repeat unit polymerase n=1 Tax=Photobacterium angustum (strain S14 / CCUG 15956) TaxID=314292 RepID=Q1ZRK2_PHOAS|nr:O-antigen polymerase [Photobacterium angustum]EAS65325.1 hypothetical protein VAS14_06378 [Photobacterium angustum S14]
MVSLFFGVVSIALYIYFKANMLMIWPYYLIMVCIYLFGYRSEKFDILEPYNGISILHMLYALASASYALQHHALPYAGEFVNYNSISTFINVTIISQLSISLGNIVAYRKKTETKMSLSSKDVSQLSLVSVFLFFSLIIIQYKALDIFHVSSYAERVLAENVLKRKDNTSGLYDFINIISQVLMIFLALDIIRKASNKILKIFASLILFLLIARYVLAGDRASAVMAIVCILAYVNYLYYRIPVSLSIFLSLSGYTAFSLLSIMRNSSNFSKMVELGGEYFQKHGLDMFSLANSGELTAGTNLIKIIKEINGSSIDYVYGGGGHYLFGGNILDSILTFIPRFIYEGREGFGNERFVKIFYPETYAIGGGNGYFLPIDGYWDFGILGVIVLMFLYSYAFTHFYKKFISNEKTVLSVIIYSLFFSQGIIFAMRSGCYASIKQFLIYSFPLLIVFTIKKMIIRNKT